MESVYSTKCTSSSCLFSFSHRAVPFCGWERRKERKKERKKQRKKERKKEKNKRTNTKGNQRRLLQTPPKQREAANYLTSPSSSVWGSEREKEKFLQWDRDGANNCVSQLMTVHAVALGSQKSCGCCPAIDAVWYSRASTAAARHITAARIPSI